MSFTAGLIDIFAYLERIDLQFGRVLLHFLLLKRRLKEIHAGCLFICSCDW